MSFAKVVALPFTVFFSFVTLPFTSVTTIGFELSPGQFLRSVRWNRRPKVFVPSRGCKLQACARWTRAQSVIRGPFGGVGGSTRRGHGLAALTPRVSQTCA